MVGIGFIKIKAGLISCFFHAYASTTKFERYIKAFEISVVTTVRSMELYTLNALLCFVKLCFIELLFLEKN